MPRLHNFNAGPAVLPLSVLQRVQNELLDLPLGGLAEGVSHGTSILEMSHRAPAFESIISSAEARIRDLLGLGDHFKVLFLQGGASLQFSMAPMNFLGDDRRADYILTGDWGRKSLVEARKHGQIQVAASTESDGFNRVPRSDEIAFSAEATYCHFTSNETIQGVQWPTEPPSEAPLICDASSDIMSRPLDVEKYGLIYAGAQKNIGPSGVTLVIVREDMLALIPNNLPTMLDYRTYVKSRSIYNTPNTFGIYLVDLVCEWLQSLGGLNTMQTRNQAKAKLIYDAIDEGVFYRGHAEKSSRSAMNVTFRLLDQSLEKPFLSEAKEQGMMGLPGHRDVGGVRASLYNALPLESAQYLADFMRDFARRNA
jgi:phosphoserine aminotransferase